MTVTHRRPADRASQLLALNFFPTFFPPASGGEQRAFYVLEELSRSRPVVSIAPTYREGRDEIVRHSANFEEHRFAKTDAYGAWHSTFKKADIAFGSQELAMALSISKHPALARAVEQHWADSEVILLQHPAVLPLIKDLDATGKRIVYLSHNCELELSGEKTGEGGWFSFMAMMAQLEARLCRMAHHVVVCSEEDGIKMKALYGTRPDKIILLRNGSATRFPIGDPDEFAATEATRAIFLGSDWGPNIEAVRTIVEEIAPLAPEITFDIVGSVCKSVNKPVPPNVNLRFQLSDSALAALMKTAHFGISPMKSGGGSSIKIADYIAHGLQVVTTAVGARGFTAAGRSLHVVEVENFADTLRTLAADALTPAQRVNWSRDTQPFWNWADLALPLNRALDAPPPEGPPLKRTIVLNEFPVKGADNGGEARVTGLYRAARENEMFVALSFGRKQLRLNVVTPNFVCLELPATKAQHAAVADENKATFSSVNDFMFPMTVAKNPAWLRIARIIMADADGIVMSHPFMLPVYERLGVRRPYAHDSHNIENLLKNEALETHNRRAEFVAEAKRQEDVMGHEAELIAACSESDAAYFQRRGAANVIVSPNGVDVLSAEGVSVEAAIAQEGGFGQPGFAERSVYLMEEFDALPWDKFVLAAYGAILGPMAEPAMADAEVLDDPVARARVLQRLSANPGARRIYVVGASERLGSPERIAVFLGSGHRPNLAAAEFLLSNVAPALPPGFAIMIIGGVCNSLAKNAIPANVHLAGFVGAKMKSILLRKGFVGLNPTIGGGGSNLKVPDYLAHGLPVVTTEFGKRGFAIEAEDGLYPAPLYAFADAIVMLSEKYAATSFDNHPALAILERSYDWRVISQRFLDRMQEAFASRRHGDILVVSSDLSIFRHPVLSSAAKLVEALGRRSRVQELVGVATHLSPELVKASLANVPREITRISTACNDLEAEFHSEGELKYSDVLWNKVEVVVAKGGLSDIEAAFRKKAVLKPTIVSGAAAVATAKDHWRFVLDETVIALPAQSHTVLLQGLAHIPLKLDLTTSDGRVLATTTLKRGGFDVALKLTASTKVAVLRASWANDEDKASRLLLQLKSVKVDVGPVVLSADLWVNCAEVLAKLGLASRSVTYVSGVAAGPVVHELELMVAGRAASVSCVMALGPPEFTDRIARAAGDTPTIACDGVSLRFPGHNEQALDWPIEDAEVAMLSNPLERRYLSARLNVDGGAILLADRLDSETVRFAVTLREKLAGVSSPVSVSLFVGDGILSAEPGAGGDKLVGELSFVQPESDKAMVALLGAARLVIILDGAVRFARAPALLAALGVEGVRWRRGAAPADAFADLECIATVEEVVERLLTRARPRTSASKLRPSTLPDILTLIDGYGKIGPGDDAPPEISSETEAGLIMARALSSPVALDARLAGSIVAHRQTALMGADPVQSALVS